MKKGFIVTVEDLDTLIGGNAKTHAMSDLIASACTSNCEPDMRSLTEAAGLIIEISETVQEILDKISEEGTCECKKAKGR